MKPLANRSIPTPKYSITATNDSFSVTFANCGAIMAQAIADLLSKAFREIQIINEYSGEIMYNHYFSQDWWNKEISETEAINMVKEWIATR